MLQDIFQKHVRYPTAAMLGTGASGPERTCMCLAGYISGGTRCSCWGCCDIPNSNLNVDLAGEDSGGNLPPRFLRVRAPLAPTDTPKLWEGSLRTLRHLQRSGAKASHVTCHLFWTLSPPHTVPVVFRTCVSTYWLEDQLHQHHEAKIVCIT